MTSLKEIIKSPMKLQRTLIIPKSRLRGSTSGLRRSIGALRNSFLLYTFAVAGGVKATSNLLQTAGRFESLKTRLVGLTGSVNNAEKAFNNFNQVAATTPFSLDDVVEAGAQLQAFGADANALIKPVTDLAAFMGTTATEAANALGRAFSGGQGSADILRERNPCFNKRFSRANRPFKDYFTSI